MSVIPLSQPDITEQDIKAVVDALRSGRLSMGPRQSRFEELLAERAGQSQAVATSSGTAALHLILQALGIGPGDEVITTPFSFIASANCILYVGAKPVFVDIDPVSLNMDPKRVEAAITPKTKAILAVEVFGNPTHMDKYVQIARKHEIPLIEDACEAIGGVYKGKPIGSFGRCAVFGFYPNKQMTTGEGGCIVTNDDHLAQACRSMRNQGRSVLTTDSDIAGASEAAVNRAGSWLSHERLGYNYRLSEIAAALGIAQFERLDKMLEARRKVASEYFRRLMDWEDLVLPNIPSDDPDVAAHMSWFVFVVRLSDRYGQTERDRIIQGMHRHEVGAANYFPCIHLQPYFREAFGFKKGDFPLAESVSQRTIALPFYNRMDSMSMDLVTQTLKVMIQREQLLKRD
ncbi:MAG: DegT/DnrJ/EryC1/StrS family aminotransferase [Phycisphaeraceae bacterium]